MFHVPNGVYKFPELLQTGDIHCCCSFVILSATIMESLYNHAVSLFKNHLSSWRNLMILLCEMKMELNEFIENNPKPTEEAKNEKYQRCNDMRQIYREIVPFEFETLHLFSTAEQQFCQLDSYFHLSSASSDNSYRRILEVLDSAPYRNIPLEYPKNLREHYKNQKSILFLNHVSNSIFAEKKGYEFSTDPWRDSYHINLCENCGKHIDTIFIPRQCKFHDCVCDSKRCANCWMIQCSIEFERRFYESLQMETWSTCSMRCMSCLNTICMHSIAAFDRTSKQLCHQVGEDCQEKNNYLITRENMEQFQQQITTQHEDIKKLVRLLDERDSHVKTQAKLLDKKKYKCSHCGDSTHNIQKCPNK